MPRYRKTTQINRKRPTPKATDIASGNLTQDDRNVKLDLILKDFEEGVAKHIADLEKTHNQILRWIKHQIRMEMVSCPSTWLDMKMSDVLELLAKEECKVPSEDSDTATEKEESEREEEDDQILDMITTTVKKNRRAALTSISEENQAQPPATGLKTRTARSIMPPPSTIRSKFQTPCVGKGRGRPGWETPLVTPKFDPRLPQTMARRNKKGEKAITSIFMSESGSPLKTSHLSICVPNPSNPTQGVNHLLEADNADSIAEAIEHMAPETIQNLRRVCRLITQITE